MIRRTHWLLLAASGLLLASCGKQESETPTAAPDSRTAPAPKPASVNPVAVVTKSGVEMVALPGGEFTLGSNQGNPRSPRS